MDRVQFQEGNKIPDNVKKALMVIVPDIFDRVDSYINDDKFGLSSKEKIRAMLHLVSTMKNGFLSNIAMANGDKAAYDLLEISHEIEKDSLKATIALNIMNDIEDEEYFNA